VALDHPVEGEAGALAADSELSDAAVQALVQREHTLGVAPMLHIPVQGEPPEGLVSLLVSDELELFADPERARTLLLGSQNLLSDIPDRFLRARKPDSRRPHRPMEMEPEPGLYALGMVLTPGAEPGDVEIQATDTCNRTWSAVPGSWVRPWASVTTLDVSADCLPLSVAVGGEDPSVATSLVLSPLGEPRIDFRAARAPRTLDVSRDRPRESRATPDRPADAPSPQDVMAR
jgi:hypothetical protein